MAEFRIILMGDFNARTASLTAYPLDPRRISKDKTVSTRGRWLCRTLADNDLALVNGVAKFGPHSGNYTSFQGTRQTVIDYTAISNSLWPTVTSFTVCPREDGYDHAALSLSIALTVSARITTYTPSRNTKRRDPLPTTTELDKLLVATLEAGKDEEKKSLHLYGPTLITTNPVKVAVHGLCVNPGKTTATAGIGLYWGPRSPRNAAYRLTSPDLTSTHAELAAIANALMIASVDKSLEITTHSKYAVQALTTYASDSAARGWRVTNGKILQQIISTIKTRWAPLHLIHIRNMQQNAHLREARTLALRGISNTPDAPLLNQPNPPQIVNSTPLQVPKISSNLIEIPNELHPDQVPKRTIFPEAHRGRNKLMAITKPSTSHGSTQ
ncbi:hypothetical protein D9615_007559 [Tricholomella constricta]|uniref:RNase H type-1 domain-containing protein n=1 Tax=Tricholomella constricta TaxID=117010 RepID=A0A8H5M270_9AGAR|nr:hypothetical protein D9615_007559 [Tricholomella constricta]